MTDDPTLLRRYAAEGAEEAFAEFVRRHLPLVYSAAVRRLGGDSHRAEDVAQIVFCAVARDAHRLSHHSLLTGWLYTATRNAVIDVIRAEKRRGVREKEAHIMQENSSDPEAQADWSQLRPVLDSAMDGLNGRDREAVLLRFFQGRSFGEIGTALGLSEDAARKRVERALEKLGGVLRQHRIVSTSAALATLLAAETVSAAPASLAASVTGAALATGGATTAGVVGIIAVTKMKAGIAAAVVVAGAAGLVTQQHSVATLRESHASAQQQLTRLASENAALAKHRTDNEREIAKLRADVARLQAAPVGALPRFEAKSRSLTPTTDVGRGFEPAARRLGTARPIETASGSSPLISAEANFPHVIAITTREASGFESGDGISITLVRSDRRRIEQGGVYLVQGFYAFASAPRARLVLSLTTSDAEGPREWTSQQQVAIARGTGSFSLVATMHAEGEFHVSFYPAQSGSSQGGIYFQNR